MGDQTEGSSSAAQGALSQMTTKPEGFLGRIVAALTPGEKDQKETAPLAEAAAPAPVFPPGMLNLRRLRVEDVAVPKAEIIAVPADIKKDDLVRVFRESGLTRLPIYDGTLDTPIGLVHLKDLALKHGFNGTSSKTSGSAGNGKNGKAERYSLRKMARPLLYAPPSMPIGVLLQKMQASRIHMALVIDEYGGVDGLVTLEDLVEQVLGQIADEHDIDEGAYWVEEKPGCYLVQARAPLEEFEAEIGMRLRDTDDEDEIDTLGGLVLLLTGRVPARGEVITHPSGLEIDVVDADPRHIKRLRVRVNGAKKVA